MITAYKSHDLSWFQTPARNLALDRLRLLQALLLGSRLTKAECIAKWCPTATWQLPSGNLLHSYWKSPFILFFFHWTWWFSIAMLNYQRVFSQAAHGSGNGLSHTPPWSSKCQVEGGLRSSKLSHMENLSFVHHFPWEMLGCHGFP